MPKLRTLLRKFFGKEVPVVKLTADVAQIIAVVTSKGEKLSFDVDWTPLGHAGSEILLAAAQGKRDCYLDYHISDETPSVAKKLVQLGFSVNEGLVSNTYDRTWINW